MRSSIPDDAAAVYEALRPSLLNSAAQSGAALGAAVLLRQGMLAWASTSRTVPTSSLPSTSAGRLPLPFEVSRELVQVMAGLILHSGKESLHV